MNLENVPFCACAKEFVADNFDTECVKKTFMFLWMVEEYSACCDDFQKGVYVSGKERNAPPKSSRRS